jgi:hypothetical protein
MPLTCPRGWGCGWMCGEGDVAVRAGGGGGGGGGGEGEGRSEGREGALPFRGTRRRAPWHPAGWGQLHLTWPRGWGYWRMVGGGGCRGTGWWWWWWRRERGGPRGVRVPPPSEGPGEEHPGIQLVGCRCPSPGPGGGGGRGKSRYGVGVVAGEGRSGGREGAPLSRDPEKSALASSLMEADAHHLLRGVGMVVGGCGWWGPGLEWWWWRRRGRGAVRGA